MSEKMKFDHASLEFRKVTHSVWAVLGTIFKYFLVTASLAVVYYIVFSFVISTDSEKQLKRENQMYRQMFSEMSEKEQLIGDVISGLRVKDDAIYRQLFNTDAPEVGEYGIGALLSASDTIRDKDLVEYTSGRLAFLETASDRVEANFRAVMAALEGGASSLPPMTSPIEDFAYARTGATVGEKINPFYKVAVYHGGLDMIAQQGEVVRAAADGVVSDVVHSSKGLGNVVTISHEEGYVTRYAHLENTRVARGQRVKRGAAIGQVGVSGNSFAPHLHYEVMRDSVRLDPVQFFFASATPEDYMEMLFMSANAGQSMD